MTMHVPRNLTLLDAPAGSVECGCGVTSTDVSRNPGVVDCRDCRQYAAREYRRLAATTRRQHCESLARQFEC